jgi:hypothetical protein
MTNVLSASLPSFRGLTNDDERRPEFWIGQIRTLTIIDHHDHRFSERFATRYNMLARNFLATANLVGALYWIKL